MPSNELQDLNKDFDEFLQHIDRALRSLEKIEVNAEWDPVLHRKAQDAYESLHGIRQAFQQISPTFRGFH